MVRNVTVTGRVACKQMMPKDEKNDRLKKEEREREEDLTRVGTLIYNEKGVPA